MYGINNGWNTVLKEELSKEYYQKIQEFLDEEYSQHFVYPPREKIFTALNKTDYEDVKVVILGQDPYHGPGQAHGLSFSVNVGVKIPPSLRNIYKELNADVGFVIPNHGYLESWAKQGVLLINAVLTVRDHEAASHSKIGWQVFTDAIIRKLNEREKPVVFILWGNYAKSKGELITNPQHRIIESVHPSPLSASRGFFGSKPFSKVNEFLEMNNMEVINWSIDDIWGLN